MPKKERSDVSIRGFIRKRCTETNRKDHRVDTLAANGLGMEIPTSGGRIIIVPAKSGSGPVSINLPAGRQVSNLR